MLKYMVDEADTGSMSDEQPEDRSHPLAGMDIPGVTTKTRIGKIPGAGPKGARMVEFEELPDDPQVLKGMYIELQKSYKDINAVKSHHEDKQYLFGEDEDELKDLLSHFYTRGMELVGVLATITFLIQLYTHGPELSPLAQGSGAVAATAMFDRWIRPHLST